MKMGAGVLPPPFQGSPRGERRTQGSAFGSTLGCYFRRRFAAQGTCNLGDPNVMHDTFAGCN